MNRIEVVYKPIDEIMPYARNPRKNDYAVDNVAASIKEFGFKVPIIIAANGEIIAGHTRLKAAIKLGMTEVPTICATDLSSDQVKAFRLADNKVSEVAQWDAELLSIELGELGDIGFDMEQFGFECIDEEQPDATEDDYEIEVPEQPKSKIGDIYLLGNHRLMCGDSTSKEDVQALMDGAKADMLLTDPPYGIAYTGKTKDALKIENDAMEDDEFISFLQNAFSAADSVMKPGAVFYIWHADSRAYVFRIACHMTGWEVRQVLIWVKNSMILGRQDYQWKHEPCLYGWKEGAGHLWASDRKQTTVLEFERPTKNKEHPTMKPVPLFDYQIKNNTKGGDIVLDLFSGSGTTIIACEQNGRVGYCMEYDPKYVDVIIDRWEKFTGQKAKLVSELYSTAPVEV